MISKILNRLRKRKVILYVGIYKDRSIFKKHWGDCFGVCNVTSNNIYLFNSKYKERILRHEVLHYLIYKYNFMRKIPKNDLKFIQKVRKKIFKLKKYKTRTKNKDEEFLVLLFVDFDWGEKIKRKLPKTYSIYEKMINKYQVELRQDTRKSF